MPRIEIVRGDITRVRADAIVNAANRRMRGGGGVDGAIHSAGGPSILEDCIRRFPNGLDVGDAGFTTAGALPAQHVIHTVGPNFTAGQRNRALLESCYRRSLAVADELRVRTVAFPLISAGVYGWPKADAVAAAIDTISSAITRVDQVQLVAFDDDLAAMMNDHLRLATPLRILQGIREVHRRGYSAVRFVPYLYAIGTWRIEISTSDNVEDQGAAPSVGTGPALRYSSASGCEFAGAIVTGATPVGAVADLILAELPRAVRAPSTGYLRWLDDLIDACLDRRALPIAFDDEDGPDGSWMLTGGGTIPIPPAA
ncbi:O-acetyl-ADP-ribose deacetylase [Gordonia hydrophobica]|uniref:O-acetyl-ADP-ribose deacetylase n=1 Tax=Gordonia hydrophobica TaxID=40516 RepID=A0ABZ2U0C8_9ACTN|nr:O-acetyl-ADP-ribose deacetylase [Gordonia hydrophobica]MBM7366960.1 O-acetyl-ADP-ribose deacetylase (regulator of RNase III) [Gordonia hydrophobica]